MRKACLLFGLAFLVAPSAHAAEQCFASIDEFNAFMDTQVSSASSVTLSFTVTGVDLNDYYNGKGWLAELADTRCTQGSGTAALKVYGTSEPLNTAHPPGTLKLEYGSYCCATGTCPVEYWADPNPGPQVFFLPTQICNVVEAVTTTTVSYNVQCDGGTTFHAEAGNHDAMMIDKAALLSEVTGGHPMTNASASNVQICFELGGPPVGSETIPVMEDVTVAPQFPSSVYPDDSDLACGDNDGTTYLKFDLSQLAGKATSAKLFVHSGTDSSSAGTGADVYAVKDSSWSETTLTWDARPALGTKIGRIDGVSPDQWNTVDVTSAFAGPAVYSFSLAPAATDTDTAHFLSKEASPTLKAYLLLQVIVTDGDGDGYPDGPDCDDSSSSVHPGAVDSCNGIDDDCNGTIDDGCGVDGGWSDGGLSTGGTTGSGGIRRRRLDRACRFGLRMLAAKTHANRTTRRFLAARALRLRAPAPTS